MSEGMAEYKQIERIVYILKRLALEREITVRKLYNFFDRRVSKRTLERDLNLLSSANIPLLTRKGQGREQIWYLEDKFKHFIPQTIGHRELLASLLLDKLTEVVKGTPLAKDAKSLLKKTRQIYDPKLIVDAETLDQSLFGFSQTGYIDYSKFSRQIDVILQAAAENRFCYVEYKGYSHNKPKNYKVAPYMILIRKGALYAVVNIENQKKYVYLLIHRIRQTEILDEKFKRRKDFKLDDLIKDSIGIFGGEWLKPVNVKLKFDPDIAETIADRIWHPSQKIQKHRDGSVTLSMKVVVSDELLGWIGSWQHYVEVIGPRELRKEVITRIGSNKRRYQDGKHQ